MTIYEKNDFENIPELFWDDWLNLIKNQIY